MHHSTLEHDLFIYAHVGYHDYLYAPRDGAAAHGISMAYPPADVVESSLFKAQSAQLYIGTPFSLLPSGEPLRQQDYRAILAQSYPSYSVTDVHEEVTPFGRLIYFIPNDIRRDCRVYFGALTASHIVGPLLEATQDLDTLIHLHVQEHHIIIIARSEGRLQLCQFYDIKDDMDVLYYVTAAYHHAGIERSSLPLTLSGRIMNDGKIFDRLAHYVQLSYPESIDHMTQRTVHHPHRLYPFLSRAARRS